MGRTFFFLKRLSNRRSQALLADQHTKAKLGRLLAFLLSILMLHTVLMMNLEGLVFMDALWLSVTSITTVGYGDFSASTTAGRLATTALIYLVGIWLLAQLAGEFLDYRALKREKMIKGLWRWKRMQPHILIINTPARDGERYLIRLVEQIKQTPDLGHLPVNIVTTGFSEGLPNTLRELDVVHYHIDVHQAINLNEVHINQANYVLILAQDEEDIRSDSLTLDLLDRLNRANCKPFVLAECLLDANRERFMALGADAVIRPVRGYPELAVRALSAPGTERVLENLFTHEGASTHRLNIELHNRVWKDIVCKLAEKGLGTALGYVTTENNIITQPDFNKTIHAKAILVMVNQDKLPTLSSFKSALG